LVINTLHWLHTLRWCRRKNSSGGYWPAAKWTLLMCIMRDCLPSQPGAVKEPAGQWKYGHRQAGPIASSTSDAWPSSKSTACTAGCEVLDPRLQRFLLEVRAVGACAIMFCCGSSGRCGGWWGGRQCTGTHEVVVHGMLYGSCTYTVTWALEEEDCVAIGNGTFSIEKGESPPEVSQRIPGRETLHHK